MKANTTHNPPPTPIQDLGDGTYYYNFNVVHSILKDEDGNEYDNYDYEQVRVKHIEKKAEPVITRQRIKIEPDATKIQTELTKGGYKQEVELGKKLDTEIRKQ